MPRKKASAFALVFMSAACVAQDTVPVAPTWMVRINPFALIDAWGPPSLRIGLEHMISPRVSVGLETGYYFWPLGLEEAPSQELSGYLFRAQGTWWNRPRANGSCQGITLDLGYKNVSGTLRDSIAYAAMPPYSKDYHLDRTVLMTRLYFVQRAHWTGKLCTEVIYGIGCRWKSSRVSGISTTELEHIDNRDEMGDSPSEQPYIHDVGDRLYFDVVLGLRICYALD